VVAASRDQDAFDVHEKSEELELSIEEMMDFEEIPMPPLHSAPLSTLDNDNDNDNDNDTDTYVPCNISRSTTVTVIASESTANINTELMPFPTGLDLSRIGKYRDRLAKEHWDVIEKTIVLIALRIPHMDFNYVQFHHLPSKFLICLSCLFIA